MSGAFKEIADDVRVYLGYLKGMGFRGVDCSAETRALVSAWGTPGSGTCEPLEAVASDLADCPGCFAGSRRPIAGRGERGAALMIVGGIPEPEDEETGRPYSGTQGELLARMIAAMNLSMDAVYISHAFKCRPRGGEAPKNADIANCSRFLKREIRALSPRVICLMGDLPLKALVSEDTSCRALRGEFLRYHGIPVMPTHAPSHLLAHPEAKREAWHDLRQIMALLARQG
jgi:DNA polymerase